MKSFVSTDKLITGGFVLLGVNIGNKKIIDDIYELSELITCPVSPGPIVLPLHKLFPYSTEVSFLTFCFGNS